MKSIKHVTSSEYMRLFISDKQERNLLGEHGFQIYDYAKLSKILKIPTPVFIPDYNYILHIENGFVKQQLGAEFKYIQSDSVVFIQAGQIISLLEVSDDVEGSIIIVENRLLNLLLSQQNLLRLFSMNPVLVLTEVQSKVFRNINRLLLNELKFSGFNLLFSTSLIQALLQKMLELSEVESILFRNQLIAIRFKEMVYANFVRQKEVSFYAKELSVTENYLNRCVRSVLNRTAKQFITEVVVLQGQIYLQDAQRDIADVSYSLNFADPSYFSRIFKKVTGKTPSEFKKQITSK